MGFLRILRRRPDRVSVSSPCSGLFFSAPSSAACWSSTGSSRVASRAPRAQTTAAGAGDLAADVAHLKSVLPTQSHTMKDVGDQWVNLWFAVQKKNWPLARFFFDQGRQQIRWTLAIRPERTLPPPAGGTVNLRSLFGPMDMSTFAALQLAIEDEDTDAFVAAYKQSLTACHSCHTAVQMPFLRPTIPTVPPSTMLSFDPVAP